MDFLNKKYKIIAFDWDGTAVKDRRADASDVSRLLESLLKKDYIIVIITGTKVQNITNQLIIAKAEWLQNLFICTNRGSEVFGHDQNGDLKLIYRYNASNKENELLDKIAIKCKKEIENTSCAHIEIIFNRLNRRKIDLMPQWQDPPKNCIDKLLQETEKYLETKGFSGGIKKAYKTVETIAKTSGLANAKITSDVKHIEVGLTDKADSINWVLKNIAGTQNIKDSEILIGGDEFGEIAGFQGSDYKMVLKDHGDITYFSVGIEPNGTPGQVIHCPGGPEKFLEILEIIYSS